MKKSLETSEWVISGSLLLILISLLLISRFHEHRKKNQLISFSEAVERSVEIAISGEVERPGIHSALPGTRLGDLVKKCRPMKFADLRGIDLDCPVVTSLEIAIPRFTEIAIKIEGAVVEPIDLTMPVGSRICDLKSKIQCDRDADVKYLRRRRLLKDGEVVVIPRKMTRK